MEPVSSKLIQDYDRRHEEIHALESEYLALLLNVKHLASKEAVNNPDLWIIEIFTDPVSDAWIRLDDFALEHPSYAGRVKAARENYLKEVWFTQDQID